MRSVLAITIVVFFCLSASQNIYSQNANGWTKAKISDGSPNGSDAFSTIGRAGNGGKFGNWTPTCWKGLFYRLKCEQSPIPGLGNSWDAEFRTTYQTEISFSIKMTSLNEPPEFTVARLSNLTPQNTSSENVFDYLNRTAGASLKIPCGEPIRVWVGSVRFGETKFGVPWDMPDQCQ